MPLLFAATPRKVYVQAEMQTHGSPPIPLGLDGDANTNQWVRDVVGAVPYGHAMGFAITHP